MASVVVFCCLLLATVCSANIVFIDSSSGSYLKSSTNEAAKIQTESLSSVVSALTGLFPPHAVDKAASDAIAQLVQPNPLKKPKAYVVLNVVGAPDSIMEAFGTKARRSIEVEGDASTAQANSVTAVLDANPDVDIISFDQQALKGCKNNCIEEHLPAAVESAGAKHAGAVLTFASGATLDLGKLSDKLFAVELASLWGGLQQQLQQLAQKDQLQQDIQVYDVTLLGLQGLAATYGADSPEVKAAQGALASLLARTVAALDEAFGGDVVYQFGCFDAVPVEGQQGSVESIMAWKQSARRRLAQATDGVIATAVSDRTPWPPVDEGRASKQFTAKAAGYGSFILLLYFSLGAVWCMCNMPMAVDTLLFGSKKDN